MRGSIRPRIAHIFRVPRALFLQSHVFLCRARRHWVVLDVQRDKYLCVDRRQFESLGPWIRGWDGVVEVADPPREATELANELLSLGVLSEHPDGGKDACATVYAVPTDAFDSDNYEVARSSLWRYAWPFFVSCAKASRQLRKQRFESIIASVRARKAREGNRPGGFDIERARFLVAVFDRLRWFYPRRYICLFDGLALLCFLARFRLYPDWVFGVRAEPFEAHCSVQAARVVLNDTVGRISGFTTIMYV